MYISNNAVLCKATATLGGTARGNDRGFASVVWQVTLKYMAALIVTTAVMTAAKNDHGSDSGNASENVHAHPMPSSLLT